MKVLDGLELTGYIKERQLKQVRALRQSWRIIPRIAIICTGENLAVTKQIQLERDYGDDIMIEVDVKNLSESEILQQIDLLNRDKNVYGIILQLTSDNLAQNKDLINSIIPSKDVDGLGDNAEFRPAVKMATDWLIAGYNVEETDSKKLDEIISKASGLETLEIAALFDNVITSARKIADKNGQQDI